MADEVLGPLLAKWLTAAEKRLEKKPGRATVMPGNNVVWDDCCDGTLWIRIISIVGSSAMSRPATQPCYPLYQVRLGLGVIRCAHTVDDNGVAPTPGEMASDAFQTFRDRRDLVQTIVCDIAPDVESRGDMQALRIEDWLPQGPQGGCVGGEITLTFSHILCTDCPEED